MMKKKSIFIALLCACAFTGTLGLAACAGDNTDDSGKKEPTDLSAYLGTDAELKAKTPVTDELLTYTMLDDNSGYEVSLIDKETYYDMLNELELAEHQAKEEEYKAFLEKGEWVIPGSHEGKPVKRIADYGFASDLLYISSHSYYDIESIYVQPGVEVIGKHAFDYKHENEYLEGNIDADVDFVQFPSTLKTIEEYAISCAMVKFGTGVEVIKEGNRFGFTAPDSITGGFNSSDNRVACFPDSLKVFAGYYPREYEPKVTYEDVEYVGNPNNPYMIALADMGGNGRGGTPAKSLHPDCKIIAGNIGFTSAIGGDFVFPSGLTCIGDSAFIYANITNVSLPASVCYIGSEAFANSRVTKVTLPDGIEYVSPDAFWNDPIAPAGLDNVYGRCTYIGTASNPHYMLVAAIPAGTEDGLDPDTDKKGYEIHEDTKIIGQNAFRNAELVWDSTKEDEPNLWDLGLPGYDLDQLKYDALSIVVPDGVVAIGSGAFVSTEKSLRSVSLPGHWKDYADRLINFFGTSFADATDDPNRGSASIIIREGYKKIEKYDLDDLGTLDELVLPDGLEAYERSGNNQVNNTKVYSLNIPAQIIGIANDLTPKKVIVRDDGDLEQYIGDDVTVSLPYQTETLEFADGVTEIPQLSRSIVINKKTIVIPKSVTSIAENAFSNAGTAQITIRFMGTSAEWAERFTGTLPSCVSVICEED